MFKLSRPKQKGGAWTEKVLHSFAGVTDGAQPNGGLVLDNKGAVYGTTYGGGSGDWGTVYELKPPTEKKAGYGRRNSFMCSLPAMLTGCRAQA